MGFLRKPIVGGDDRFLRNFIAEVNNDEQTMTNDNHELVTASGEERTMHRTLNDASSKTHRRAMMGSIVGVDDGNDGNDGSNCIVREKPSSKSFASLCCHPPNEGKSIFKKAKHLKLRPSSKTTCCSKAKMSDCPQNLKHNSTF